MIGAFDPLSTSAVPHITSLRNRDQRVAMIGTIKAFADAPAPISSDAVHKLVVFENSLYPVIQADRRWFFANAGKTEAVQFARDLNVMHRVAAKTFETLVERRGEWSKGDNDPLLQRAVGFALFHHCAAIKWCFFRHEPVKPTIWPELHALYKFADAQGFGFATMPISLFADEAQYKITALSLYLRALMLEVLNTGSLTMAQIEIADGWLAEWTPDYALDETYSQRSHALYVDLDLMAGMQLVTGNAAKPSYRYVRLEGLKEQVEAVRTQLRTGNPYLGRGAPNEFSMEEQVALLSTLERLYTTLLQASASRIEERKPVENQMADVRLGFEDARLAVTGAAGNAAAAAGPPGPDGESMKFGDLELSLEMPVMVDTLASSPSPATDTRWTRWKIHDMSSKGVGLMVDRVSGEIVWKGLLDIQNRSVDGWVFGGEAVENFADVGWVIDGAVKVSGKMRTVLFGANLANADESLVVPIQVISTKLDFQAAEAIGANPVSEKNRVAIAGFDAGQVAGFQGIETADKVPDWEAHLFWLEEMRRAQAGECRVAIQEVSEVSAEELFAKGVEYRASVQVSESIEDS